ncbi:hypothetical protein LSAT2_031204 [Lamellibrachia satsuma]|nr:hypothetical protein LSAT2_031204 [Lamellibrachia satsuma]
MAAKAGLQPGDGILAIGMSETANMSHNQAKMEIIRAGNDVDFIIQRNVVPVKSADDVDAGSPRAEISEESTEWRSRNIPAQDPNVQSRSFKMLQQQLAAE